MTLVLVMLTKQDVQTFSACNWFIHAVFTGRGFSGCGTLWWSWKCCHCLICSPNRKCQCFPAYNSFTHALYLIIANIRSVLTYAFPSRASLISVINMMKLIQIEKSSIKIIELIYLTDRLCKIQLPPLEMVMDQASKNYIMAIYGNKNHPPKKNTNLNAKRSTRVSSLTSMPMCRTTKLQRTLFYAYRGTTITL